MHTKKHCIKHKQRQQRILELFLVSCSTTNLIIFMAVIINEANVNEPKWLNTEGNPAHTEILLCI